MRMGEGRTMGRGMGNLIGVGEVGVIVWEGVWKGGGGDGGEWKGRDGGMGG